MTLLDVRDLSVRYEPKASRPLDAVQGVSFSIEPGEFVGLIGESGSGKTTLGTALLRLLQRPGRISGGSIEFNGTDITHLPEDELRSLRWRDLSTVFQSSMNSLNPVVRVEAQFRDAIEQHSSLRGEAVTRRIRELFDMVIIDPKFMTAFPHELSGGMRQRVNLALALALDPKFILLDEPTTGLDVVVQHSILENVRRLQAEQGFAVLFISHDIGTVLDLSDRILVMYAGRIVEDQSAGALLREPLHPYTKGLLGSYGDPRERDRQDHVRPGSAAGPQPRHRRVQLRAAVPRADPALPGAGPAARAAATVGAWRATSPCCSAPTDGAEKFGEPKRGFEGPQFVKTADESRSALANEVVLSVENVSKVFERRRGFTVTRTRGRQRRQLRAAAGRGDGTRGPERQRQVDPRQDDHRRGDPD